MVHANDTSRDESDLAAKQRFDSFRMSTGLTPTSNLARKRPSSFHGRSHSRTSSISSPSLSVSVSANSIKSTNDMSSVPQPPLSQKRPISHHRRRSSVSTRTESADLMGVSVPDLPVSSPKDNLNLGEKDSIRRRALLALEGKPDYTVATVEIPELTTPDLSKGHFEFPTKPSFPPGNGASLGAGLNTLTGKRDSFKLLSASASSKDQLQTLVEEEEEDDEGEGENKEHITLIIDEPAEVLPSSSAPVKTASSKPRPVGLTLRPLALALDNCVTAVNGLPTPTSTPTPLRNPPKALALVAGNATSDITPARRHSLASNSSSAGTYAVPAHRPSLNGSENTSRTDEKIKRRSSISYKTSGRSAILSLAGLPTPDGTPTIAERRQSNSSSGSDEDFSHRRPLSMSEQHFLFKSHNALLARITDLEHALSSRHPPYLPSAASDVSSEATEPNDEMLQLVADLKAERDELKRDVDGWRNRVNDLDHQLGLFAKRLEAERRDAWVARSRAGLLEVEKSSLEKALAEQTHTVLEASSRYNSLQAEFEAIKNAMSEAEDRWSAAQAECSRLTKALEAEKHRREALEKELDRAGLLATPTARSFGQHTVAPSPLVAKLRGRGLGFTSMDSESSATDVESPEEHSFKLRAVMEEEEEDDGDISESDNGLAGYEDEDDLDLSVQSPVTSLGSVDDFRQVLASPPSCNTPVSSQTLTPGTLHSSHRSLSTPWTFPLGRNVASPAREPETVDRFFECLEDGDSSPPLTARVTHEGSKRLFSMGFSADDDDMPPFLLPNDVGVEVIKEPVVSQKEEPRAQLASAALADVELPYQEDHIKVEDVFEEQEINGIRIMVTSPLPEDDDLKLDAVVAESPVKNPVPLEDEADDQSFNFGQSTPPKVAFSPPNRNYNSPSSIPRRTRSTFDKSSSPTGSVTGIPIKRSTSPSMIPQPVFSPSRISRSPSYRAAPTTTFTRQPQRKTVPVVGSQFGAGVIHANERSNVPPTRSPNFGTPGPRHPRLDEKEKKTNVLSTRSSSIPVHEYPEHHGSSIASPSSPGSPITSFMSSRFATRLSFQTFTSFMPRSWGPRSSVAAAANCLMMPSSSTSSSFCSEDEPTTPPLPSPNVVERREPRYVSKQKQLEKLRSRLDLEHTKGSGTGP